MMLIKYDPKQDLKNWLRIKQKNINDFTITKFYPFDKNIELNQTNFNLIVKTISLEKIKEFENQAIKIKQEWEKRENELIKRITDYLNIPFKKINFKVSLTTAFLMPYDFKDAWFMVPTHKNIQKQFNCILHELFHFYHLQKDKTISLKELEEEVQKFLMDFHK